MSGSTENQTSGAFESRGRTTTFTWHQAQRMLPLVGQIAADLARHRQRLAQMQPELARLDRQRHSLDWPQRARRYQLHEEIAAEEEALRVVTAELDGLGLAVIQPQCGQVGFPTVVNSRRAFFSWRPGEKSLLYWHFADDDENRQPIPTNWTRAAEPRRRSSSRSGPAT